MATSNVGSPSHAANLVPIHSDTRASGPSGFPRVFTNAFPTSVITNSGDVLVSRLSITRVTSLGTQGPSDGDLVAMALLGQKTWTSYEHLARRESSLYLLGQRVGSPIPFADATTGSMQGPRYTSLTKLLATKRVTDLFT
jgi:hypothetical protein